MAKTQKWAQRMQAAGINVGKAFSMLLLRWLPPVAAEKVEEGPIITAAELARGFLDGFVIGLISDNKKRLDKKGGNGMNVGLIIIAALVLVGCSKKATKIETIPEARPSPVVQAEQQQDKAGLHFGDVAFAKDPIGPVTVYFDFDSDRLKPQEAMKLDRFIDKQCIIDAHACTFGTDDYNIGLSEQRGSMVNAYIGGGGEIHAWGETHCTAKCREVGEPECGECRKVTVRLK